MGNKENCVLWHMVIKPYIWLGRIKNKTLLKYNRGFNLLFDIATKDFSILQKKVEIESLCNFVNRINPSLVCEIGSYRCGTSFLFANSLRSAEQIIFIDKTIYNADLLKNYTGNRAGLCFIEGDSCAPEVVSKIERLIGHRRLDFLFIDGDHRYDGAKRDLLTYYDLVEDGGYIAFHDIVPDHRTLHNVQSESWSGEVHKLWRQVKQLFESVEFVEQEGQDGFGIGVLKKDSRVLRTLLEKQLGD